MDTHFICQINDVAEGEARGFTLSGIEQTSSDTPQAVETRLIVLKLKSRFHVYKNSCPHTGVNLNWMPDQFFDVQKQFLQCAMHGALFRPEDGFCVRGPCAGQSLQAYESEVMDGSLYLNPPKE